MIFLIFWFYVIVWCKRSRLQLRLLVDYEGERERECGQSYKIKLVYIKSKDKRYSKLITCCGICIQWEITQPLKTEENPASVTTRTNLEEVTPSDTSWPQRREHPLGYAKWHQPAAEGGTPAALHQVIPASRGGMNARWVTPSDTSQQQRHEHPLGSSMSVKHLK